MFRGSGDLVGSDSVGLAAHTDDKGQKSRQRRESAV